MGPELADQSWEKMGCSTIGPINAGKIGTNTENILAFQMRSELANQSGKKLFVLLMGPINARKIVKNTENIHWLKIAGAQGTFSFQGICGCEMQCRTATCVPKRHIAWPPSHRPKWVGAYSHINGSTVYLVSLPNLNLNP